jgi:phospholipid-binding lipoprotein MlaA
LQPSLRSGPALRHCWLLLALLLLGGCATAKNHYDPIEPLNRVTYSMNDAADKLVVLPATKVYRAATPHGFQILVGNFFDNIGYMNTVINDFLQGKGEQGMSDFARFLVNSTIGFAGLGDPATGLGLKKHHEDLGQTLAVWGAPQGAYLVYPMLGPSSVRDSFGIASTYATNPLFWIALNATAPEVTIPLSILSVLNTRSHLMDASNMVNELALDPYIFTREAWRQNRLYQIYDGHPPQASTDDDFGNDPFGP